jgi:hypothetical protein
MPALLPHEREATLYRSLEAMRQRDEAELKESKFTTMLTWTALLNASRLNGAHCLAGLSEALLVAVRSEM